MSCNLERMAAMFSRVHFAGWMLRSRAAFSAGRPNASHPIGCITANPRARL